MDFEVSLFLLLFYFLSIISAKKKNFEEDISQYPFLNDRYQYDTKNYDIMSSYITIYILVLIDKYYQ